MIRFGTEGWRGQFCCTPNEIRLYSRAIDEYISQRRDHIISKDQINKMCLAHELFNYFKSENLIMESSDEEAVPSEIAANIFSGLISKIELTG